MLSKRTIKYKVLPIALGLAGLSMFMNRNGFRAESKDIPVFTPKKDITLRFFDGYYFELTKDSINKFAKSSDINHIYIKPMRGGNFKLWTESGITKLRNFMEERIAIAPEKISGQGDLFFRKKEIKPADSLWFAQHGWRVNPQNTR